MSPRHSLLARRIGERDAALRRLRRLTVLVLAGAGALAAVFAGLAAKAFPGRSGTATQRPAAIGAPVTRVRAVATPPPLVSAGVSAPAPAPAAQAPVSTQAAPVAVSGGT